MVIPVVDHLSSPLKMIFFFMMGGRRALQRSDTPDAGRFIAAFSLRTSKIPRCDKVRKVARAWPRAKLEAEQRFRPSRRSASLSPDPPATPPRTPPPPAPP